MTGHDWRLEEPTRRQIEAIISLCERKFSKRSKKYKNTMSCAVERVNMSGTPMTKGYAARIISGLKALPDRPAKNTK